MSVSMRLAGFRSRWTTPRLCACASAASACMHSSARLRHRQRAFAGHQRLERLAAHELHDHQPLAIVLEQLVDGGDAGVIEPRDGDGFGAKAFGDRFGSFSSALSTLIATSRCSVSSRARYTVPMPPRPTRSRTRYLPMFCPTIPYSLDWVTSRPRPFANGAPAVRAADPRDRPTPSTTRCSYERAG